MGHSILIVDDSATTRAFIRRAVQMVGIHADTIHEAANGTLGLEVLRAHRVDGAIVVDAEDTPIGLRLTLHE